MDIIFTENDINTLRKVFNNREITEDDIFSAWQQCLIVRIADAEDYKYAYEDFAKFEDGFEKEVSNKLTFVEFMNELKKGYGKSDCVQIARLIELENGIWYDNDYS